MYLMESVQVFVVIWNSLTQEHVYSKYYNSRGVNDIQTTRQLFLAVTFSTLLGPIVKTANQ